MPDTLTLPAWSDAPPTKPGLYRWRVYEGGSVFVLLVTPQRVIELETLTEWKLAWPGEWQRIEIADD